MARSEKALICIFIITYRWFVHLKEAFRRDDALVIGVIKQIENEWMGQTFPDMILYISYKNQHFWYWIP